MTEFQKNKIDECRVNGMTITEIADATGVSVSAIKSYLSRKNETHCKYCGAALTQTEGYKEKHFCNQSCYFRWRYERGELKRTVYEKKCAYARLYFLSQCLIASRALSRNEVYFFSGIGSSVPSASVTANRRMLRR